LARAEGQDHLIDGDNEADRAGEMLVREFALNDEAGIE
jgi:hypothetical protein